jgi:hypothetical protein
MAASRTVLSHGSPKPPAASAWSTHCAVRAGRKRVRPAEISDVPFSFPTLQGGAGARVIAAPLSENIAQGRDLQSFYRYERFTEPGEPFVVIPVAERDFDYF